MFLTNEACSVAVFDNQMRIQVTYLLGRSRVANRRATVYKCVDPRRISKESQNALNYLYIDTYP